jgi:TDG/mug DNA glycosylase family protein
VTERGTGPTITIDAEAAGVPMALARLHRNLDAGASVVVRIAVARDWDGRRLDDVMVGAGFETTTEPTGRDISMRRLLTLPDTVGEGMRLLVCGLNPSIHAAEMGVGFGRPGNRFWPAALAAGVVTADRDPDHALQVHGMGMTDLVKRATRRAAEIDADEYSSGIDRLNRLVHWLRPAVLCMVGLAGWRTAVDRKATAGPQSVSIGDRPVYVMPSTSGLNAHAQLADLTGHLRAAAATADS